MKETQTRASRTIVSPIRIVSPVSFGIAVLSHLVLPLGPEPLQPPPKP